MYLHSQTDGSDGDEHGGSSDKESAFRVLTENSNRIDCIEALNVLPGDTDIKKIRGFLENVIEKLKETRRQTDVLESLMVSERRLVHERRMYSENRRCDITEEVTCPVCRKRIGDSAFARYPDGTVVHYFCSKDRKFAARTDN